MRVCELERDCMVSRVSPDISMRMECVIVPNFLSRCPLPVHALAVHRNARGS